MARGVLERGAAGKGPSQFGSSPEPKKAGVSRTRRPRAPLQAYMFAAKQGDPKGTAAVLKAALAVARKLGPAKALALIKSPPRIGKVTVEKSPETSQFTHQSSAVQVDDYREHEARRWKEIREGFLAEHRSVTAPELAKLTGSKSVNPSSRAHTWTSKGLIFSVNDGSVERYPLFQLRPDDAKPRPEIKAVLEILTPQLSNWQVAIWFTAPNAWTGDWRRPVDLLGKDLDVVVNAARQEVAEQVL